MVRIKRTNDMSYLLVNDIFDELMNENKRLSNELMFANNCLKVLTNFKTHLISIHCKYETIISSEDKQEFSDLGKQLDSVVNHKPNVDVVDENDVSIEPTNEELKEELCESEDIKPEIETNVRRSGRTGRKYYAITTNKDMNRKRDPNRPKWTPKVYVIPDPMSEPNSLLLLRKDNYDISNQSFICPNPFCQKPFRTGKLLYQHFHNSHHQKKRYFCDINGCNKGFKIPHHLKCHQNMVHSEDKPFHCDINGCDYKCKTKRCLDQHMVKHSDEHPFKCQECGKQYKIESRLKAHHNAIHRSEPTVVCRIDECNKLFKSHFALRKHKVSEHNKVYIKTVKWHECDWPECHHKTKSSKSLEEHKRIHTGERPFACSWSSCAKRFRTKPKLRDHERIHLNIKPYTCDWPGCAYRCSYHGNINKHMRVHQKT